MSSRDRHERDERFVALVFLWALVPYVPSGPVRAMRQAELDRLRPARGAGALRSPRGRALRVSTLAAGAAAGLAHDPCARPELGTRAVSPETGGVLAARLGSDLSVELQQKRPGMLAPAARHALEAAGLRVSGERDVLVVRIEDRSGAAAQVFGRLAGAGVNVHHTYVASGHRIVIAADDPAQALEALRAW